MTQIAERKDKAMNLERATNDYIGFPQEPDEDLTTFERRNAFKAGAEWSKQKAVEWINKYWYNQWKVSLNDIEKFKKAMEE